MCHVDCIARQYCEDGVVYRVSRRSSPPFVCGTSAPPLDCSPAALEQCEDGCDEQGLECADADAQGGAGAAGQGGGGGEGGASN
jgi:hypothetical protein